MKIFSYMQRLLFVIPFLLFLSCSNSTAEIDKSVTSNTASSKSLEELNTSKPSTGTSKIQTELDKAKKEAKAVFVIITDNTVTNLKKAQEIAKGAGKIYRNSTILTLERADASSALIVKEWGLSGVPVPFIIVVSPLGIPSGGLPIADATAESIAAFVPSPKLDMVYEAVNNKKNVILLFTKSTFADKNQALLNCKDALKQLNNDAVLVEVDMADTKEFTFMSNFKIDRENATQAVTMVINKSGQIAATYNTTPVTSKIVATAKAPIKKACCPSGSSAGCGTK